MNNSNKIHSFMVNGCEHALDNFCIDDNYSTNEYQTICHLAYPNSKTVEQQKKTFDRCYLALFILFHMFIGAPIYVGILNSIHVPFASISYGLLIALFVMTPWGNNNLNLFRASLWDGYHVTNRGYYMVKCTRGEANELVKVLNQSISEHNGEAYLSLLNALRVEDAQTRGEIARNFAQESSDNRILKNAGVHMNNDGNMVVTAGDGNGAITTVTNHDVSGSSAVD